MKRNRCRDPNGFTLVEVMVAIMVSAMMVTAFFSIALTSRIQTIRVDHKLAANQLAQQVLQNLKNYVADPNAGPTATGLPASGKLTGDANGGWALVPGLHDVTDIMKSDPTFYDATAAAWLVNNPAMSYCVADNNTTQNCTGFTPVNCPDAGNAYKCVAIIITWNEKGA